MLSRLDAVKSVQTEYNSASNENVFIDLLKEVLYNYACDVEIFSVICDSILASFTILAHCNFENQE